MKLESVTFRRVERCVLDKVYQKVTPKIGQNVDRGMDTQPAWNIKFILQLEMTDFVTLDLH